VLPDDESVQMVDELLRLEMEVETFSHRDRGRAGATARCLCTRVLCTLGVVLGLLCPLFLDDAADLFRVETGLFTTPIGAPTKGHRLVAAWG
jgi:hypothetical protein